MPTHPEDEFYILRILTIGSISFETHEMEIWAFSIKGTQTIEPYVSFAIQEIPPITFRFPPLRPRATYHFPSHHFGPQ